MPCSMDIPMLPSIDTLSMFLEQGRVQEIFDDTMVTNQFSDSPTSS